MLEQNRVHVGLPCTTVQSGVTVTETAWPNSQKPVRLTEEVRQSLDETMPWEKACITCLSAVQDGGAMGLHLASTTFLLCPQPKLLFLPCSASSPEPRAVRPSVYPVFPYP